MAEQNRRRPLPFSRERFLPGYIPAMESNKRLPGEPRGVLLFIATLCNRANLSPLLSGQKWQNPPGETPGPPLRRTRMGLVAPHTPDRVWRLRVVPPERSPRQMPPKTWESNPCGGICPLRGFPRAIPQVRLCWVTALAAAGLQPAIESAAPGGKEAPTTRRGGQPAACGCLDNMPPADF